MAAVDIHPKVVEWLKEMFRGVDDRGDFIFVPGFGSTALFIDIDDVFDGQHVRVQVDAPILMEVAINAELLQYIGYRSNDFAFGHLAIRRDDASNTGILVFRQTLLGDALDKIELEVAAHVVALTADRLDNDLQMRFGGQLFGA
jgi:hypothetical protein